MQIKCIKAHKIPLEATPKRDNLTYLIWGDPVHAKDHNLPNGDNEGGAHPQPQVMGAIAYYGSEFTGKDGKKYPPLLYSTELARSTNLKFPAYVKTRSDIGVDDYKRHFAYNTLIQAKGDDYYRKLLFVPVVTDMIYGLVSVRTDGETILIAASKKIGNDFDVKIIKMD